MKFRHMHVIVSNAAYKRHCRPAALLALSLLLVSCANPPPDQAAAGQECVYVRVTGSNLPVKQCSTPEERAAIAAREREAGEQGVRDMRDLNEFGVEAAGAESLP